MRCPAKPTALSPTHLPDFPTYITADIGTLILSSTTSDNPQLQSGEHRALIYFEEDDSTVKYELHIYRCRASVIRCHGKLTIHSLSLPQDRSRRRNRVRTPALNVTLQAQLPLHGFLQDLGMDAGHAELARSNATKPDLNAHPVPDWDISVIIALAFPLKMTLRECSRR